MFNLLGPDMESTLPAGEVIEVEKAPVGTEDWKAIGSRVCRTKLRVGELLQVDGNNPYVENEGLPQEPIVSIQDNSSGVIVETRTALYRFRNRLATGLPDWAYGPVNFTAHAANNVANFATDYFLKPAEIVLKPVGDTIDFLTSWLPNHYEERLRRDERMREEERRRQK